MTLKCYDINCPICGQVEAFTDVHVEVGGPVQCEQCGQTGVRLLSATGVEGNNCNIQVVGTHQVFTSAKDVDAYAAKQGRQALGVDDAFRKQRDIRRIEEGNDYTQSEFGIEHEHWSRNCRERTKHCNSRRF